MNYMHSNAKPFYLKGNNIGCLLIHGFTGTPAEMLPLGKYLNEHGYTVAGVSLKGHGTRVEDMETTNWKDWLESGEIELINLQNNCDDVIIIGLSMGGIISLNLSSKYDVKGVVSLASPIRITNKKAYFTPILKYFRKYEIKGEKKLPEDIKDYVIGYDKTPLASVHNLIKLIRKTKRRLKKVKAPLLIIQSKNDNTVEYTSAEYILNKVSSQFKKLIYLKESGHMVTVEGERERVFKEIRGFIKEITD